MILHISFKDCPGTTNRDWEREHMKKTTRTHMAEKNVKIYFHNE